MTLQDIFSWVLKSSINSSFMILGILLYKRVKKNFNNADVNYYLWFIPIVKLCIPFLPSRSFSLFDIHGQGISSKLSIDIQHIEHGIQKIGDTNHIANIDYPISTVSNTHPIVSIVIFGALIWVTIGLFFIGLMIVKIYRTQYIINKSRVIKDIKTKSIVNECRQFMNIKKDIAIYVTNDIKSPAICGIVKPKILLPHNIFHSIDDNKLRYVFLHELAHYKRKDIIMYYIIEMIKAIHWFNPIVRIGLNHMKDECEIHSDKMVLSYLESKDRIEYGHMIIDMLVRIKNKPTNQVLVMQIIDKKSNIKRRINMIINYKKDRVPKKIITFVAIGVLASILLTTPKPYAQETKNTDMINLNSILNSSNDKNVESQTVTKDVNKQIVMLWPEGSEEHLVSSKFGKRICIISGVRVETIHKGIDIATVKGEEVLAVMDGEVVSVEESEVYGKSIVLKHNDSLTTVYRNCADVTVMAEQKVKAGAKLGVVQVFKQTTGPHLHFEVLLNNELVDPSDYLIK